MCLIEEKLIKKGFTSFVKYCDKKIENHNCCSSWSLGHYLASISGRNSCLELTSEDVKSFKHQYEMCKNYTYSERCSIFKSIGDYILDKSFRKTSKAKFIQSHLAISKGISSKDFYESIKNEEMVEGNVEIVAMDFDLKFNLFDEFLIKDLFKVLPSFVCIFLILIIYTGSIIITVLTIFNVFISLVISAFIYYFVLKIYFFPFFNLLAIIILYATGVDAIFVFVESLSLKGCKNDHLSLQNHLSRRFFSPFRGFSAASLTTIMAYSSSSFIEVPVLRCFSIFASLSVFVHFFVSVFYIPCILVLNKKCSLHILSDFYSISSYLENISTKVSSKVFSTLAFIVKKLRFLIIAVCFLLASILIIFFGLYFENFSPSMKGLKFLVPNHPFEMYDLIHEEHFKPEQPISTASKNLSMRWVWGVKPGSKVEYLTAEAKGTFQKVQWKLESKEAQTFFILFCKKVRSVEYYTRKIGSNKNNCFIDDFKNFMKRGCVGIDGADLKPCCSVSHFPFQKNVFKKCFKTFLPILAKNNVLYGYKNFAGLRFDANFTRVVALVVEFVSNVPFDADYEILNNFYVDMENFTKVRISQNAPDFLKDGWFNSELGFFDLQRSVFKGLLYSKVTTFFAVFFITFAFLGIKISSLYAILTMILSVFTSISILLLSGWKFNVFESMAFSIVMGLSIDFTFHNASVLEKKVEKLEKVNFRVGKILKNTASKKQTELIENTPKRRFKIARRMSSTTLEQLTRMNGAIFMGGLTTLVVGVFFYFSILMPYRQLSILMITVVSVSWIYSTFFFMALLTFIH